MCHAISTCHQVDEVKDMRDKAMALEAYARQAKNLDAERKCAEIRVRAERKCGQLLASSEKSKGSVGQLRGRDSSGGRVLRPPEDQPKTLAQLGVSKDQSSKWQKLAAVPEDEFEAAIANPEIKPSANNVLKTESQAPKQMDSDALWLWGRLRDMRAKGLFNTPIKQLLDEWTQGMHEDADSIVPALKQWVNEYDN